ncbi:MAG: DUF423 domain-containing protein [Granulosicoccus sp.]
MNRWILSAGAILAATAVMSGAFGAHALQNLLDAKAQSWYDTAVTYHMTHAIALIATGLAALIAGNAGSRAFRISAACFLGGVLLFSGSLYTMAFSGITKLGIVTPFGGVLLIAGWLGLAYGASRIPFTGHEQS